MLDQINKYSDKLVSDRSADLSEIAFAALDDTIISSGEAYRANLASDVINKLGCLCLLVAAPSLPFAEFLLRRTKTHENRIIPRDTETRTFLHDIPILRKSDFGNDLSENIAELLNSRKGVIVEGIGIVATGALTVEQAYINWSSIFHSTFIKYLEDILAEGFLLPDEAAQFNIFRTQWLRPLTSEELTFRTGPLDQKYDILDEISRVGAYTVQRGLVDSFFGNISYRHGDLVFISQTAASLDALAGCIDPVPFSNSSTVGITASSELVAHQRIYQNSDCLAILHGHPRFSVVMSMLCEDQPTCEVTDCWRDCKKTRYLGDTPVVAGEIGAGGLAKNVPPVIRENGRAIVYGHGVFCIGKQDFKEAFQGLVDVENWCRNEYFFRLDQKLAS
jgi:ribulose-5-phosphate 4-epimerase/fuculose-1-phosphate aldolase